MTPEETDRALRQKLDPFLIYRLEQLEARSNVMGAALRWWYSIKRTDIERLNAGKSSCVELIVNALDYRAKMIGDLYAAFLYSNTDSIQANLHYMDYISEKLRWDDFKTQQQDKDPQ